MESHETEFHSLLTRLAARIGRNRLLEVTALALVGLVSILWLNGGLLFFWDLVLPFRSSLDTYYYSFTWGQLLGEGAPSSPFEYGSYFPTMVAFHQYLGLSLAVSQQFLIYLLFAGSGLSMYALVSWLRRDRSHLAAYDVVPITSALAYMFNYYVAYYLLSDFFPSWFLYALLPLTLLLFLKGAQSAILGKTYWWYVAGVALVFQAMSAGFWEPPYLVYTIFLLIVAWYCLRWRSPSNNRVGCSRARNYLLVTLSATVLCSLWWLYNFTYFVGQALYIVTPRGAASGTYSALIQSFAQPPPNRFLNLIAIYPQSLPSNSNNYTWGNLYTGAHPLVLLLFAGVAFVFVTWAPLLVKKDWHLMAICPPRYYFAIGLLIFFGMQGANPVLAWAFHTALGLGVPGLSSLYATGLQFIQFPLVFLLAIAFGEGIGLLRNRIGSPPVSRCGPTEVSSHDSPIANRFRGRHSAGTTVAVVAIVVICVGVYPWYLWTPEATQVYATDTPAGTIHSVIDLPSYVTNAFDYLGDNSGSHKILVLPEGYNLFSMNYQTGAFADTAPIGLLSGSAVIYGNTVGISDAYYDEINSLIYRTNFDNDSFARLMTVLDVKFILVVTDITGAGSLPYYNISYLLGYLDSRSNISLNRIFGPLDVYQNLELGSSAYAARPVIFSPSISDPLGYRSLLPSFDNATSLSPSLPVSANESGGNITLSYNDYIVGRNPVLWENQNPLNVSLSLYSYLLVTVSTSSSDVWFYIDGPAGFVDAPVSVGTTILQPLNPTPYPSSIGPWDAIYQSSQHSYTLVYSLDNQTFQPYSTPSNQSPSTVKIQHLLLGLSLFNATSGASGTVTISNLSVAEYVEPVDALRYLESAYYDPNSQVLVSGCGSESQGETSILPSVSLSEVSPTSYLMGISNATGEFALVLDQSYSAGWQASIGGSVIGTHCMGDGYANVWMVSQSGNFTVDIQYLPQLTYNVLTALSVIGLLTVFVLCAVGARARHKVITFIMAAATSRKV